LPAKKALKRPKVAGKIAPTVAKVAGKMYQMAYT
jgi:hypothetical protein